MSIAIIYRWTVRPGMEDQFRRGWIRGTREIHARCGSHGARLHRAADGTFLSYALWPDEAARRKCFADNDFSAHGFDEMREAAARYHGEEILSLEDDLLDEAPG